MPRTVTSDAMTPADRLRELLTEAEIVVSNLKGAGEKAVRLLQLLDEIESEQTKLSRTGIDLRPEEGRIVGLCSSLRRQKATFVCELRRGGGLAALRAQRQPAEEAWWWFLDRDLAMERKKAARRYGLIALGVAILVVVGVVIFRRFFSPDSLVVEIYSNQTTGMDEIMRGNYAAAIPYFEQNLILAPDEAEWPIRLGVLQQIAGDAGRSQVLFDLGRELSANDANFYLQRAQVYSEINSHENALQDAEKVTRLDPSLPMAFLLLGRSHAGLGHNREAIAAYETVLEMTEDSKGNETIYVLAKIDMMQLYQAPQPGYSPPAEEDAGE